MRQQNFHFDLRDNTLALANALNDIIIKRFKDDSRVEIEKKIDVRFVYGSKQRVMYDVINAAKTLTLPVVALDMKGFSHDPNRIFNKNSEFYDTAISNNGCARYATPTPIKINYGVTILTKYRTDLEQIASNFIPHSNPYFVISIKVPQDFKLINEQEIRSHVMWDGNFNIEYPDPISNTQKSLFTATTNFTVDGWLFKPEDPPAKPIYSIDANLFNGMENPTELDILHVETYPIIEYACVNGIPQTTLNPDFIPGETSIKDLYLPKKTFDVVADNNNMLTLCGNGLTYDQNKVILCGNMDNLNELGEYDKIDISNISTNKTPISIIKKGLFGIDITKNTEYLGKNVQYKLPNNMNVGDYYIIILNESGLSNPLKFKVIH